MQNNGKLNPGHGYVVRELLGKGQWKMVYRAVKRGEWRDFALATFIAPPSAKQFYEELRLLLDPKQMAKVSNLQNVARQYGAFRGDDERFYLVEELLYRPLTAFSPLRGGDEFFQMATDLCVGLASLHSVDFIHRDLKLDNCGVDHQDRAKIFDLGSATSEGSTVVGTILTRAPELFIADRNCTKESDVWALGAVLFALRTGNYPFVLSDEAKGKPNLDDSRRNEFNAEVRKRATKPQSESSLQQRIRSNFPVHVAPILSEMLCFDPARRPRAVDVASRFASNHRTWLPAPSHQADDVRLATEILYFLQAVAGNEARMSPRQWAQTADAIDELEKKRADSGLIQQLRDLQGKIQESQLLSQARVT